MKCPTTLEYAILKLMSAPNILSDAAANAGLRFRRKALGSGHPVVFVDDAGRYVQEWPDGTLLEIRFKPGAPRDSHLQVIGEVKPPLRSSTIVR